LLVAKVEKVLTVSKGSVQMIDMERFNVKEINESGVKEESQIKIRKEIPVLENLEDNGEIGRTWGNIRRNVKISAQESLGNCESKHRKTWLDEE
jgi:hypothetical protein